MECCWYLTAGARDSIGRTIEWNAAEIAVRRIAELEAHALARAPPAREGAGRRRQEGESRRWRWRAPPGSPPLPRLET